jgi:ribose transport system substrate-binding protein
MNVPRRLLFTALVAISPALLAAAEPGPKIGVLLKGRVQFWNAVEKGAREAAAQAQVEVIVKSPVSETDIGVQVQMLNSLAAQGVDAIVIAPTSKDSLAAPLAALAAKGVKIVVIDTALSGKAATVFVGTDHVAAGKAAGKLLASLVSETDEICLLKHSQTSGATAERDMGALAGFRETRPKNIVHGDIYASAEQGAELQKAQLVLTQYPGVKAILSTSTPGTLAMLQVLQEKELGGMIKLLGFGFNLNPEVAAAIESGALSGWIAQLPKNIGAQGVEAAVKLLKGETVPAVINTDFIVITKGNLHQPAVQALLAL